MKTQTIVVSGSAEIEWMYPEIYGNTKPLDTLTIALMHTRAAANIAIRYDSESNGWQILRHVASGPSEERDGVREYPTSEKLLAFIPDFDPDDYEMRDLEDKS